MKIDPYKHKERYLTWKKSIENGIAGINKENSELILKYLFDMENGLNVASGSKKGSRSYIRLNTIRQRMVFLAKIFEDKLKLNDLTQMTEEPLHIFFNQMSDGTITRQDGEQYKSTVDYVKIFKAFWHWHQKINRKNGIEIRDITTDLDVSREKPVWVYLTENEIKKLCENAKHYYKVLIMFLFDSGIRAPTELMNIKVSDFYNDFKELSIRDEISKTFGRRIKLMFCSDLIKSFIINQGLEKDDFVFTVKPYSTNQYLKRLSEKLFGTGKSPAGETYNKLTMYDFRHCSCCYWLPRYKSESALKFRFGWKKSDKIHYYSEMLGMRDTISEEDMLIDVTKTEIEQKLVKSENENEMLKERVGIMEVQMKKILQMVNGTCFVVGES